MRRNLRLAIGQINCTVGDFDGNAKKMIDSIQKAKSLGADMIAFPELALTGYPPEDLLLKPKFVEDSMERLDRLAMSVNGIAVITGFVDKDSSGIYNAAAVIYNGKIKGVYHKMHLPNYGVFDERRYFKPGSDPLTFKYGDLVFGVNICEDIWHKEGPTKMQAAAGASLIVNINASPYHAGKMREREEVAREQARANKVFVAYANLIGGQDELVFDGQSMVIDDRGSIAARAEPFREDMLVVDLDIPQRQTKVLVDKEILVADKPSPRPKPPIARKETKPLEPVAEVYQALLLGLRDYVAKNGFNKVVIGLSGGIDSALVAALAADALGSDNVTGVFMPSRYSSQESADDARKTASNLGIKFMTISIEQIFKMYLVTLEPQFAGLGKGIAEENLQARIRGNIVMALSNKFGWLVLTTGNKSEMSTGYATLYGDMAGGFAVIKDVPKTLVYKLAKYRNSINRVILESVLTKEPTAELKADQKDSDTLPPYETLDQILKCYVEEDKGFGDIISAGYDKETVNKVIGMVDKSEYKRRQSPPGIKITPKAFGRDRRMPITNKYK